MLHLVIHSVSLLQWRTVLLTGILLYLIFSRLRLEYRIRALGGRRAPRINSYLPFGEYLTGQQNLSKLISSVGLGFILRSIKSTRQSRTLEFWRWMFDNFGTKDCPYTVETDVGLHRFILTANPELIKAVLATQFDNFGKGQTFHDQWTDFLGDSIFTTDGQAWRDSRHLIQPFFTPQRRSDLQIFERNFRKLSPHINGQGQLTCLSKLFYRYTLDVSTQFLYGQAAGSLDNPAVELADAMAEVQRTQAALSRSGSVTNPQSVSCC